MGKIRELIPVNCRTTEMPKPQGKRHALPTLAVNKVIPSPTPNAERRTVNAERLALQLGPGSRFQEKDRNLHRVPHFLDGLSENDILEETVTMGRHGDQIDLAFP